MKRVKRYQIQNQLVEWDHPLECIFVEAPLQVAPFRQTNTYTTYRVGIIYTGSDNSQQFRFSYQDKNGNVQVTNWSLLVDLTNRLDISEVGISIEDIYYKYLENDIFLEYRNTAGPVYMSGTFLTYPSGSTPSAALQSVCSSFLSGPQDIAVSMITPAYTGSRPGSYNANVGLGTISSTVTQFTGAVVVFSVSITQLFHTSYPNAGWTMETYRQNSTTPLTLISSQSVQANASYVIFPQYLLQNLVSNNYVLKFRLYNGGVEIASPFANINITTYLGLALHAARISDAVGRSHALSTVQGSIAGATMTFTCTYTPPGEIIPTGDSSDTNFVELSLVISLSGATAIPKAITVWYNTDGTNGVFPMVINEPISNQSVIYLKTGGASQTGTKFSLNWANNLVTADFPFYYNIFNVNQDGSTYPSEEFTTGKLNISLQPLVTLAQASPGQWVTNSNYQTSVPRTRRTAGICSINLQAKYGTAPPVPPTPQINEENSIREIVQQNEVEEGEYIYEKDAKRLLRSKQFEELTFEERDKEMKKWLLPTNDKVLFDRPVYSARRKVPFHSPEVIEHIEKAKSEAVSVLRDNPSWRYASHQEFISEFNKRANSAARVKYPYLTSPETAQYISQYYEPDARMIDIYKPGKIYQFAPAYESLTYAEKPIGSVFHAFWSDIFTSLFGNRKNKQLASEIEKAKYAKIQNQIDRQAFNIGDTGRTPDLSPEAFNYYWFLTGYNVYNQTQVDMLQSIMEHTLPPVYDPKRSAAPIETDSYGKTSEFIEQELNNPYNQLAFLGVGAAAEIKKYQRAQKALERGEVPTNATELALLNEVQRSMNPKMSAANDIATFFTHALAARIVSYAMEAVAQPFSQKTGSALDWFIANTWDSSVPRLPYYGKKQLELGFIPAPPQNKQKALGFLPQISSVVIKNITNSSNPIATQETLQYEENLLKRYENAIFKDGERIYNVRDINQTDGLAWQNYTKGQKQSDDVVQLKQVLEFNDRLPSFEQQAQVEAMILTGQLQNQAEVDLYYMTHGFRPVNHQRDYIKNVIRGRKQEQLNALDGQTKEQRKEVLEALKERYNLKYKSHPWLKSLYSGPQEKFLGGDPDLSFLKEQYNVKYKSHPWLKSLQSGPSEKFLGGDPEPSSLKDQYNVQYKSHPWLGSFNSGPSVKFLGTQSKLMSRAADLIASMQQGKSTYQEVLNIQDAIRKGEIRVEELLLLKGLNESKEVVDNITQTIDFMQRTNRTIASPLTNETKQEQAQSQNIENLKKANEFAKDKANEAGSKKDAKGARSWNQTSNIIQDVTKTVASEQTSSSSWLWNTFKVIGTTVAIASGGYMAYNYFAGPDEQPTPPTDDIPVKDPKLQAELNDIYDQQFILQASRAPTRQDKIALVNSDLSASDKGRARILHAVSSLFRNLNSREATFKVTERRLIFEAFAHTFRKQAMRQALRQNLKGYFYFKTLSSILAPQNSEERKLKKTVEDYYLYDKLYDSRDLAISKTSNSLDNATQIFENSTLLHEFIERTMATPPNPYKRTFNNAFVIENTRPSYEYTERISLREPRKEFPKKRDTKAAALIKYFNEPLKLNRLSFDNRQYIKQRVN